MIDEPPNTEENKDNLQKMMQYALEYVKNNKDSQHPTIKLKRTKKNDLTNQTGHCHPPKQNQN
jgi:hypothetical protein